MNRYPRPFYVITPPISYTEWVCWDGGPTYATRDVVEVEASTRREAIRLALPKLKDWADRQRSDGLSPFAGLRAEPAICPHGHPHFVLVRDRPIYQRSCPACFSFSAEG